MDDFAWDNDVTSETYGQRVPIEYQFQKSYDVEKFIMSLPIDEAKVLIVRTLGFEGEQAAQMAGFSSVWVYVRALKNLQIRAKMLIGDTFEI
jgi:DNA-directed RNA polymerase specialized sigma24 family protein